jgi:DNA-binding response OmpR family regulator
MTTATEDSGARRRVLVVEDNEDIRLLLRLWLSDDARCAEVVEADSVVAALAATRGGDYDAVVLDFMLGDGTATDCLPQLRQAWPAARIVVYTASLRVAREARMLELGADLLVEKVSVVVEDVVDLVLDDAHDSDAAA